MMAAEENRLGGGGVGVGMEGCYTFRGVNLVMSVKVLMAQRRSGWISNDCGRSDRAC